MWLLQQFTRTACWQIWIIRLIVWLATVVNFVMVVSYFLYGITMFVKGWGGINLTTIESDLYVLMHNAISNSEYSKQMQNPNLYVVEWQRFEVSNLHRMLLRLDYRWLGLRLCLSLSHSHSFTLLTLVHVSTGCSFVCLPASLSRRRDIQYRRCQRGGADS